MSVQKLQSGRYAPRHEKVVTVWPKPDPDGDGEPVMVSMYSPEGDFLGEEILTTEDGRTVHHYLPPPGFVNVASKEPGADGKTDNHVRKNPQGGVHRNHLGQAVNIREGTALIEHPDGTHELLPTEYAQVLFGRAHDKVGD